MILETKNLKLAQVRYFDTKHNGVEIPEMKGYAFLYRLGDHYINYLNPYEELPVYDRVPYANTTRDGVEFGTKIVLVQGECKDGLCYVIDNIGVDNIFEKETIPSEQLEEFVLKSELFFVDRVRILINRKGVIYASKYCEELKKLEEFNEKIGASRNEVAKQK